MTHWKTSALPSHVYCNTGRMSIPPLLKEKEKEATGREGTRKESEGLEMVGKERTKKEKEKGRRGKGMGKGKEEKE